MDESEAVTTIFRIENENGDGPYRGTYGSNDWGTKRHNDASHPTPLEEDWESLLLGTVSDIAPFRFGFKDLDQLLKWFSQSELDKLYKLGYNVVTIDLHPQQVWMGKTQIAYEKWSDYYEI